MSYYRDEKENIRIDLLDKEAYSLAHSFVKRNPRDERRLIEKESLSSAQLRRFYGKFKLLEKKVKEEDFAKIKPFIKMEKSKAHYAANPSKPKIPESFKNFLIANIDRIEKKTDFEDFMLHFEAVVGFFYGIPGVGKN